MALRAEVVREITGFKIEGNAKDAKELFDAIAHVLLELNISADGGREKHPELKPLYYLADGLLAGGIGG